MENSDKDSKMQKNKFKFEPLRIYIGTTHKTGNICITTTSAGANLAGKTIFIVPFEQQSPSALMYLARRFRNFANRAEIAAQYKKDCKIFERIVKLNS